MKNLKTFPIFDGANGGGATDEEIYRKKKRTIKAVDYDYFFFLKYFF